MRLARMPALAVLLVLLVAPARAGAATLVQVGTFSSPTYLTSPPGDARLFVVERGGTIRIAGESAPFLDITNRVLSAGAEQGLLSMAFAPDFATSGLYYVYFTNRSGNGDIEIDEFRGANLQRTLLTIEHSEFGNHNGGQLQFGPDGLLYAGTGDGGSGGDPHGNGQNDASRLGKLLRIDTATGAVSNFAKGLRNPWRFSFDRQTGDLVIADVGQGRVEEVDFAAAPGRGQGANYGWNRFEGNEDFSTGQAVTSPPAGFTFPVVDHTHAAGWCSITGGYVVRDPSLPELAGRYVYATSARATSTRRRCRPRATTPRPACTWPTSPASARTRAAASTRSRSTGPSTGSRAPAARSPGARRPPARPPALRGWVA